MDCDVEKALCGKYGIQGFPTIKVFGPNKKRPEDYQGGRDAGSIASFALELWAKNAPPPEVRELTGADVWAAACDAAATKICVIAFLPNILDSAAAGRNAYLATMRKAADHHKSKTDYAWLWAEGAAQPALERNFDVGGFGYPALVAFSPKHRAFTVRVGEGPSPLAALRAY